WNGGGCKSKSRSTRRFTRIFCAGGCGQLRGTHSNRNARARKNLGRLAHVGLRTVPAARYLVLFADLELVRLVKSRGEMIRPQTTRLRWKALLAGVLVGALAGCGDQKANESTAHAAPAPEPRASTATTPVAVRSASENPSTNELSVTAPLIVEH